ncbi:MAG: hypothetical protein ACYDCH_11190 [Gaiellaceae bacterium]
MSAAETALVTVAAGPLDEGLDAADAGEAAGAQPARGVAHAEPGVDHVGLRQVDALGGDERIRGDRHHHLRGVGLVGRQGAAPGSWRSDAVAFT